MGRTNGILIPAETPWLHDPNVLALFDIIEQAGHRLYFVGGCVRNALLKQPVSDIDLSTDALPREVAELAEKAGIKAVPTGIDHGTVTLVSGGVPFEVTTFRRDVQTDGRRAVVAYSQDMSDDARRRDFTMNALYATRLGAVLDPLGGLSDLLERRVRFIENPVARIREDYLRILRFFRFNAWYGDAAEGYDPDALHAIASNLEGLNRLSAERIGQEMRKLLAAPDPSTALAVMRQTGVLQTILPGADDRLVPVMAHIETDLALSPNCIFRLVALGGSDAEDRLRLSKAEARDLNLLRKVGFDAVSLAEVAYRHGATIAEGAMLLRATVSQEMPAKATLDLISESSGATFPVQAADLMPTFEGAALGRRLAELERRWIDSGFSLDRSDLLRLA